MHKLLWPVFLQLAIISIIVIFQYNFPIFLDIFEDLNTLSSKNIAVELWPIIMTVKILIIPIIASALIIRTFCRYIHDSRRSISRTHFKSAFFYLFSITFIMAIFSGLTYFILLYSQNPGRAIFFLTKKPLTIKDSKYIFNIMLTMALFLNSLAYIISTYIIESSEMRRINKINDMGPLMLESSYITTNLITIAIISLAYLVTTSIFFNSFFVYLNNLRLFLQSMTYIIFSTLIVHLIFTGLYMSYTNISIKKALIGVDEK